MANNEFLQNFNLPGKNCVSLDSLSNYANSPLKPPESPALINNIKSVLTRLSACSNQKIALALAVAEAIACNEKLKRPKGVSQDLWEKVEAFYYEVEKL